jgi:hypothetical protein
MVYHHVYVLAKHLISYGVKFIVWGMFIQLAYMQAKGWAIWNVKWEFI